MSIQFLADGVTDGLWIDDVLMEYSPVQLAGIREVQYPRCYGVGILARPVKCLERCRSWTSSTPTVTRVPCSQRCRALSIASGRGSTCSIPPIHAGYDALWLEEMREHGYTGPEELLAERRPPSSVFAVRSPGYLWDPDLPGSINVAWMWPDSRTHCRRRLRASASIGLPVVEDLRGRWTRNVDAYRYVWDHYWDRMCPYLLAWEYPCPTRCRVAT